MSYVNKYGLINAKEADIVSENCSLFTLEHILLSKKLTGTESILKIKLLNYIMLCKTDKVGLYNQLPFVANNKDDYMSPDQLIAFVGGLYINGQKNHIKEIWSYLKANYFTYDNVNKKVNIERLMQPMAVAFVAVCAGNFLFYPLLILTAFYSCITKKGQSSGKLKAWVVLNTLQLVKAEKFCQNNLNGFSNFKEVFLTYFKEEKNPIRLLVLKKWQI